MSRKWLLEGEVADCTFAGLSYPAYLSWAQILSYHYQATLCLLPVESFFGALTAAVVS